MQFRSICKLSNKYSRDILQLSPLKVRPVETSEEALFRELMQAHHYLGSLPKIGNTLWYFATVDAQPVALLSFSAAALKPRNLNWSTKFCTPTLPNALAVLMGQALGALRRALAAPRKF